MIETLVTADQSLIYTSRFTGRIFIEQYNAYFCLFSVQRLSHKHKPINISKYIIAFRCCQFVSGEDGVEITWEYFAPKISSFSIQVLIVTIKFLDNCIYGLLKFLSLCIRNCLKINEIPSLLIIMAFSAYFFAVFSPTTPPSYSNRSQSSASSPSTSRGRQKNTAPAGTNQRTVFTTRGGATCH